MGELPVLKPTGSHLILIKPDSRYQLVIPMHTRDLAKGTLRAIIRQSKRTVDEFLEYL